MTRKLQLYERDIVYQVLFIQLTTDINSVSKFTVYPTKKSETL